MFKLCKKIVDNHLIALPEQLSDHAKILPDNLTVEYTRTVEAEQAMGLADSDSIAVVQGRYPLNPFPLGRCNIGYFEITVLKLNPLYACPSPICDD